MYQHLTTLTLVRSISMIIYADAISVAMGISPITEHFPDYNFDFIPDDSINLWGGKTWDKESWSDHPFVGGEIQKKLVANGKHHLLNSVTVVDSNGNVKNVSNEVYEASSDLVHFMSKEGHERRGLDYDQRKTNKNKKLPQPENSLARLSGDQRTDAQKKATSQRHMTLEDSKIECIHCKKSFQKQLHTRWHGDNCKSKP